MPQGLACESENEQMVHISHMLFAVELLPSVITFYATCPSVWPYNIVHLRSLIKSRHVML